MLLAIISTPILAQEDSTTTPEAQQTPQKPESILSSRFKSDRNAIDNLFTITQHRPNFVLPITYVSDPSTVGNEDLTAQTVDNKEAKFQLSVKFPLYLEEKTVDGMYFGFTLTSFWQLYNSQASKPFRETNYQPEVFYQREADFSVLGYDFNTFQVGFNHMSNGQSGVRSRSWNRLFASLLFSDVDNIYYLKAWYRIPEDEKLTPDDPSGDDNPEISNYYGRAEMGYGTRLGNFQILALLRNNMNFNTNRGSIELNLTYPITDRYELLLQYFNGYGDSLIDYNHSQERIGVGFQLVFL
ncbi:phospholipase A [Alteromonas pelagimontana]|uniref:Phospholipase A1 n=2 Tax=Alteromonas pelagimontana TaxID=1858656 RepID=A0A6N3IZQ0_9ALTE|nr:phospholipase A [Alteromonas pelagimontana]